MPSFSDAANIVIAFVLIAAMASFAAHLTVKLVLSTLHDCRKDWQKFKRQWRELDNEIKATTPKEPHA